MTNPGANPWQEIGDRVWVRRYAFLDQTIGAIGGLDGLLIVDSRSSHRQAVELRADARMLGLDVRWVVNTHRHWDHAFGNAVFKGIELWGHDRCATGLLENGERERAELIDGMPERADEWREVVITPPRWTFRERATLDLGDRSVELRYLGRGHTDGDTVILVPDADVLFGGDLIENGGAPSFGDSFPLEWPATADALLRLVRGPVAPGHGDVADRTFVAGQVEELRSVEALGRSVAAGEASLEAAVVRGPFGRDANREAIERALAQARGDFI